MQDPVCLVGCHRPVQAADCDLQWSFVSPWPNGASAIVRGGTASLLLPEDAPVACGRHPSVPFRVPFRQTAAEEREVPDLSLHEECERPGLCSHSIEGSRNGVAAFGHGRVVCVGFKIHFFIIEKVKS